MDPYGDSWNQVGGGLMVAVLGFIGFESAPTLAREAIHPKRALPRAMVGVALGYFSGVVDQQNAMLILLVALLLLGWPRARPVVPGGGRVA